MLTGWRGTVFASLITALLLFAIIAPQQHEYGATSQDEAATALAFIFSPEMLLAYFTAGLLGVGILTYLTFNRQADLMDGTLKEMKADAVARVSEFERQIALVAQNAQSATDAAIAAKKSADMAEKALLDLETPFLYPVIKSMDVDNQFNPFILYGQNGPPGHHAVPRISFTVKNYGRTPALIRSLRSSLRFLPALPTNLNPNLRTDISRAPLLEIGAEMETVFWENCTPQMDYAAFNAFRTAAGFIWFFGEVSFADIFGGEYTQTFCLVYLDTTRSFVPWHSSHNKRARKE